MKTTEQQKTKTLFLVQMPVGLYERKVVDTGIFEELKKQVYINDKAVTVGADQDFLRHIRQVLPGMEEVK